MSKTARRALAKFRKGAMGSRGHTYGDLARLADVTYSMADKWVNARRNSDKCESAFETLTGQPSRMEEGVA